MEQRHWHENYDYFVPTTMRYPRIPASELLLRSAHLRPDKTAIHFYGTEISFSELRDLVLRAANALNTMGVKKGDRVGLHLPNTPQYIIAYYATLSLGAIAVSINPTYTTTELKKIIQLTEPGTLITSELTMPYVRPLQEEMEIPRLVVTAVSDFIAGMPQSSHESLKLEKEWIHFSKLLEPENARVPKVEIRPEDPAIIMFTGGTTGIPKGAVLTHANIVAAVHQAFVWANDPQLLAPEKSSSLAVLPFFHIYGHIICLNLGIFAGHTLIVIPRFELEEFMGMIEKFEEISFMGVVPTLLNAIFNHPRAQSLGLDRKFKLVNSGGAPCPTGLLNQIRDNGVFLQEGWGMTETTSLGVGNPMYGPKKPGSIGVPFIDADIKLVDVNDGVTEVKSGEPGELIMKGPTVMKGYWNNPDETANHIRDGWLYTGDIATMDEDGYLYIVDRKKDMVIAGGYNIYPRDIDEVLHQFPKVAEAIAVGIPHDYRGETIKAYVVLKEGKTATEEEIIDFCKEHLASYKVPKMVEFRKDLPKSAVGKLLRKALRDEEMEKKKD